MLKLVKINNTYYNLHQVLYFKIGDFSNDNEKFIKFYFLTGDDLKIQIQDDISYSEFINNLLS